MNDEMDSPLSDQGERRRREILRRALHEARGRRRGLRRRRAAGWLALAFAVSALAATLLPQRNTPPQFIARQTTNPTAAPATAPRPVVPHKAPVRNDIAFTWIATDPGLSSRWALGPQQATWKVLNDDELLADLSAAGKPAALARVDGQARILFREKRGN